MPMNLLNQSSNAAHIVLHHPVTICCTWTCRFSSPHFNLFICSQQSFNYAALLSQVDENDNVRWWDVVQICLIHHCYYWAENDDVFRECVVMQLEELTLAHSLRNVVCYFTCQLKNMNNQRIIFTLFLCRSWEMPTTWDDVVCESCWFYDFLDIVKMHSFMVVVNYFCVHHVIFL